ncbi:antibiotic biosynthesis monooxygenase [Flavobacterium coralii]|uniref:putative quinol monooxygenase n=1 Tax=Flavobacterium coralii TaxID=2838017 RepID=UPI000C525053|nr:hypothetical protein [Flavobacterium sp.]
MKPGKEDILITAVQNNIAHSRREVGNLSFSLYQPDDEGLAPIWFERFTSKEAHNLHMRQGYFKNAIKVILQSLAGKAHSIELTELKEIPIVVARLSNTPKKTYTVIALLDVQPENRKTFTTAIAKTAPKYRTMDGNLEYNLYRYKDEPNKFVLIEGWESKAYYETQLQKQDITTGIEGLASSQHSQWAVKDISQ